MKNAEVVKIISFCFLIFLSLGAGAQTQEVSESIDDPLFEDDAIMNQIEELNQFSDVEIGLKPFIYSGRGRRSPFQRPRGVDRDSAITEAEEAGSGLEGYGLESFKLTTVLWDIKYPKALVKSVNGEVYSIEEGTKIGRSNGYVAKIREGEVIVIESREPGGKEGRKTYKTQVLKLGR